ncbi:quinone-dependent dihydroorotate dehydrogenase [Sphingomonas sp. HDW15A]|uniref:quinone-dependent dihydroorotate dehydrogenase n=1 Tax=Sphingomonas sp. HDW15A TaxID=2714942 RepID=UPI00140AD9B9|nr:quinone-dependent dihydroorotate dehydrogenase [Sphingomonas sp. HDW15A]QIK96864.1 quinone-dependent dihydroorotate dehydrogenase [Sphingomonas sp. HDW15A]
MRIYPLIRPLIFRIDTEATHRATIAALKWAPNRRPRRFPASLTTSVAGVGFPSPVGLAAGFDKDAEVADAMLGLGFGFVEVGTLTPLAQAGNPRPRLFRLAEDLAVINRMGFNNRGQLAALARLRERDRSKGVVGVNVGANKDSPDRIADYADGVRRMAPVADFITVNISSPNTPGLRDLQTGGELNELLAAVREVREPNGPPVFLKVAPDLEIGDHERIARAAIDNGIDALIVANTTISRPALRSRHASEAGGLSGAPLAPLALDQLRRFRAIVGPDIPLVSAGGIGSADDAWQRICAGASLVQLYSALVYEGPRLAWRIAAGLAERLKRAGMSSISEAIGSELR